ncbi:MAG: acyltransferase family protein, partial [Ascidiaceihabitans sp.]|nr:acyltransferase family protein [Ascidiaceihabitans sp.]
LDYRADIDGIRAIAVMSVVLYHFKIFTFGAWFGGVDVFFVVSGYLVGGHILTQIRSGVFSFRDFYRKRSLRILPALFAVILLCIGLGALTMMPDPYQYFGGAALTSVIGLSNFWFNDQVNYFNPQATLDPLIHTWSLGVEEQFYVLAPIVLLFLNWMLKSRLLLGVAVIIAYSLWLSMTLSFSDPQPSFYLLHTRAWELGIGLLIYELRSRTIEFSNLSRVFSQSMSTAGLLLLLGSLALLDSNNAWPGYAAALPVLGTAILLAFNTPSTLVSKGLSNRGMRLVGLSSYSFYLVHQPIASFLGILDFFPKTLPQRMALFVFALMLGLIFWRWIELPFRDGTISAKNRKKMLIGSGLVIVGFAFGTHFTKGFPTRLPVETQAFLKIANYKGPVMSECMLSRKEVDQVDLHANCHFNPTAISKIALWGDSHSATLADGMLEFASASDFGARILTLSSCQPVPNFINNTQKIKRKCAKFNSLAKETILTDEAVEIVVMFATWDNYIVHGGLPNMFGHVEAEKFYSYPVGSDPSQNDDARRAAFSNELERTIGEILASGKKVVLVASFPRPDVFVPGYLSRQYWYNGSFGPNEGYPRKYFDAQTKVSSVMFADIVTRINSSDLALVEPSRSTCSDTTCQLAINGQLLYMDGNHPTPFGASLILDQIMALGLVGLEKSTSD